MIENEVLPTSCEISEPSPITPKNESRGNANDANNAILVPSLDLPLHMMNVLLTLVIRGVM